MCYVYKEICKIDIYKKVHISVNFFPVSTVSILSGDNIFVSLQIVKIPPGQLILIPISFPWRYYHICYGASCRVAYTVYSLIIAISPSSRMSVPSFWLTPLPPSISFIS